MMLLIKLVVYTLVCYGIANTIIYANGPFHVFAYMHKFCDKHLPQMEELLSCFICLPWWIGMVLSALDYFLLDTHVVTPMNNIMGDSEYWYAIIFIDGAFTTGIVWLINTIQSKYEKDAER